MGRMVPGGQRYKKTNVSVLPRGTLVVLIVGIPWYHLYSSGNIESRFRICIILFERYVYAVTRQYASGRNSDVRLRKSAARTAARIFRH